MIRRADAFIHDSPEGRAWVWEYTAFDRQGCAFTVELSDSDEPMGYLEVYVYTENGSITYMAEVGHANRERRIEAAVLAALAAKAIA